MLINIYMIYIIYYLIFYIRFFLLRKKVIPKRIFILDILKEKIMRYFFNNFIIYNFFINIYHFLEIKKIYFTDLKTYKFFYFFI